MSSGTERAEKMPGLSVRVDLDVQERDDDVVAVVESTMRRAWCGSCRRRALAHHRAEVHLRDAHCFSRATRLVGPDRCWPCTTKGRARKGWTEKIDGITTFQVPTIRAGSEASRQVGHPCRSAASVAPECGVGWDSAWAAAALHGRSLVEVRRRVSSVRALGVD
ncbi:MAG: hypothetical protein ACYCVN_14295 [Acidimicrobiales bacterium]